MTPADGIPEQDRKFLHDAAQYLEKPSFLMRVADMIGVPMATAAKRLMPDRVANAVNAALRRGVGWAANTVPVDKTEKDLQEAHDKAGWTGYWHMLATMGTGGVAGIFGLPGLAIELPITTAIMLRSIAAIASEYGADLNDPEVRLECLSIFMYGGAKSEDDAMESAYLSARAAMAGLIRDAAQFLATNSAKEIAEQIAKETAPALIRYIARIAAQFNVVVSEKFLAQTVPIISIATGAGINAAFTDHFNRVARFHFGIRKMERQFGRETVQALYFDQVRKLKG